MTTNQNQRKTETLSTVVHLSFFLLQGLVYFLQPCWTIYPLQSCNNFCTFFIFFFFFYHCAKRLCISTALKPHVPNCLERSRSLFLTASLQSGKCNALQVKGVCLRKSGVSMQGPGPLTHLVSPYV